MLVAEARRLVGDYEIRDQNQLEPARQGQPVHAGDHAVYADTTPEWFNALRDSVNAGNDSPPQLVAPFLHASKSAIVRFGAQIDAPMWLSWSCYAGGDRHCGRCGTCVERAEAFHKAEVIDPTHYEDSHYWVEACAAQ